MEYCNNGGQSVGAFINRCSAVRGFALRDSNELEPYGITTGLLDEFGTKISTVEEDESNNKKVADRKIKTENRNKAQKLLSDRLTMVKRQLSRVFNSENSEYDTMFQKAHSGMAALDFINHCKDIVKVLNISESKTSPYNFKASEISIFELEVQNLIVLEKEREAAETAFNNDTFQRSENRRVTLELLEFIVGIGRTYWKRINPAKAQDYVVRKPKTKKTSSSTSTETEETANSTTESSYSAGTSLEL